MQITKGRRARAQRVVIYGPEGIGKSSIAANFPNPVFIDTEGSTDNMDVARMDKPTSYTMLKNEIAFLKANPTACQTLVIDTIDWAETLLVQDICNQHGKRGIEDFGYGNGYTYAAEEMKRFLDLLQELVELGINVVLTAHAQMRKFEQPDELGAYDRWELKLGKKTSSQTAPIVKEWADMVLFANYKTTVVTTDSKKKKAQGGERVIYTQHHPAWDAKNRHGLPEQIPLDYSAIAHLFQAPQAAPVAQEPVQQAIPQEPVQGPQSGMVEPNPVEQSTAPTPPAPVADVGEISPLIPQGLRDLMIQSGVTQHELMTAIYMTNVYPIATPVEAIAPDYWNYLITEWDKVYKAIEVNVRIDEQLPFEMKEGE